MISRHSNIVSFDSLESRQMMAADLVVSSIAVNTQYLATNEHTPATITVKNIGSSTAPAGAKLRLRFSKDAVWGNSDDWILGTWTMLQDLGPGKSGNVEMNTRATAQGTGQFRIAAYIDPTNVLAESNEKNNIKFSAPVVNYYEDMDGDTVNGTAKGDRIYLREENGRVLANVNGVLYGRQRAWMTFGMRVDGLGGHDRLVADPSVTVKMYMYGGHGNDIIVGGSANDSIKGENGKDQIYGGAGNDYISGGNHDDACYGQAGDDNISGGNGNDTLDAGLGKNTLSGGAGNDSFFAAGNALKDVIGGGDGTDVADTDDLDFVDKVETVNHAS